MSKIESIGWKWIVGMVFFIAGFGWFGFSYETERVGIYIHELGHVVFGFGGEILGNWARVVVDWPIADMGSMLLQHILSGALAVAAALYFKPMGGFGIGWSAYVTWCVFSRDDHQFSYDMISWTPAWYPVTIAGTVAVVVFFMQTARTGKVPLFSRIRKKKGAKHGRNIRRNSGIQKGNKEMARA